MSIPRFTLAEPKRESGQSNNGQPCLPCILQDENGEAIGLLVDLNRYNELTKNDALGTCSSHMAALLCEVVSQQERRLRIKRLTQSNQAPDGLSKIQQDEAKERKKTNKKKARKKYAKRKKTSKLPQGRRRAVSPSPLSGTLDNS